ncbi:C2H2-type zinc finger protein [Azonexus sp.]|uniref:C2H2-type zinc finger protein n=1 Tax=Azonexus sp. TaxID=1872668 RepID=UPI0035ADA26C
MRYQARNKATILLYLKLHGADPRRVWSLEMHISYADIARVKREAKKIRAEFPETSLMNCQSIAAQRLLGVRSFHELTRLREKTRLRDLAPSENGVTTCAICGLHFCMDDLEDVKAHRNRHDAYEEAVTVLGYAPQHYPEREARKKKGHLLAWEGATLDDQVDGALMVIRAWFDRSLDSAIDGGYWKQHPTYDTYVSYVVDDLNFSGSVTSLLVQRFGRIDGVIPKGRSYWYPPK